MYTSSKYLVHPDKDGETAAISLVLRKGRKLMSHEIYECGALRAYTFPEDCPSMQRSIIGRERDEPHYFSRKRQHSM